jgi:hypothetical protein
MKIFYVMLVYIFIIYVNAKPDNVNTTLWDQVLKRYVYENRILQGITLNIVNYKLIANDSDFLEFIKQIESANITNLNKNETYAFYINVYNAFAIKMVIEHNCKKDLFGDCDTIQSIRDIGTIIPYKPVWGKIAGIVAGEPKSLDDIENFLRDPPNMKEDPRLHTAIVCASISCPNLRKEAYTNTSIDQQLTDNFNNYLLNTKKGMFINQKENFIQLSSIFNWFESDFTNYFEPNSQPKTVIDYILLYLYKNNSNYQYLQNYKNNINIEYFSYNWDLNADPGSG